MPRDATRHEGQAAPPHQMISRSDCHLPAMDWADNLLTMLTRCFRGDGLDGERGFAARSGGGGGIRFEMIRSTGSVVQKHAEDSIVVEISMVGG